MAKLNFNINMKLFDEDVQKAFTKLEEVGKSGAREVMGEMRIKGIAHARELLDRLIYMTPKRRDYIRTGDLRDSVKGFVRNEGGVMTLYMFASGVRYALFNELGTYLQSTPARDIIADARELAREDMELLIIEYGRLGGGGNKDIKRIGLQSAPEGLEPRPFMYPTMVWLEIKMAKAFDDYLKKQLDSI